MKHTKVNLNLIVTTKMVNLLVFTFVLSLGGLVSSLESGGSIHDTIRDATHVHSRDPNDIQFLLYPNPTNKEDYDELIYNNAPSVTNSRYKPNLPAILLSHGFTQNKTSIFPILVRNAYLKAGYATTANIIVVDWGKLSSAVGAFEIPLGVSLLDLPLYIDVLSNVPIVGKRLQEFITFLQSNGFLSGGDDVHLVGQSLGAHVSGYAGQFYQQATGSKIKRITGTDPAAPGFQNAGIDERLDSSDAEFVDIVHTNQGVFGYLGNLGHIDFYVNGGGPIQAACLTSTKLFCSHDLATNCFANSIDHSIKACSRSSLFTSVFCTSSVVFGEPTSTSARGSYNVKLSV